MEQPRRHSQRSGRRSLRWAATAALALVLLLVVASVVANLVVVAGGGDSVATSADAPSAQVAIVLGASVGPDGRPSAMLADRLETGIELY